MGVINMPGLKLQSFKLALRLLSSSSQVAPEEGNPIYMSDNGEVEIRE
jgi:hypothetical protein